MTSQSGPGGAMLNVGRRALMLLARRGAFIARAAIDPASVAHEPVDIHCQRHGEIMVLGALAAGEVAELLAWQFLDEDGARYVLSKPGRAHVRRIKAHQAQMESDEITDTGMPLWAAPGSGGAAPALGPGRPGFNPDESPLAKLRNRADREGEALLTREQYEAGERLRYDLWRAGLTSRVTQQWNGIPLGSRNQRLAPGTGIEVPDATVGARERVIRALAAVGTEYIDLLIDVCGHLRGLEEIERTAALPQRSARRFLQNALTALARHYGMLPPENAETMVRSRLQHWGAPQYRLPAKPLAKVPENEC